MSNSAWSQAAPLYKMEIPNDPRLGWIHPRPNIILWTIYVACAGLYCLVLFTQGTPVILACVGVLIFIVGIALLYRRQRPRRPNVQCAPLSEEELRRHVVNMQGSVILTEADKDERSALGRDLGVMWVAAAWMCIVTFILLWSWRPPLLNPIMSFAPITLMAISRKVADRWIAKFKSRIYTRACVGCGYEYGGPVEPITLCPECGVILPILIRISPTLARYSGGNPPHES